MLTAEAYRLKIQARIAAMDSFDQTYEAGVQHGLNRNGYLEGAAAAFGLLAMAEAIREKIRRTPKPGAEDRYCCWCGGQLIVTCRKEYWAECPDCGEIDWSDTQGPDGWKPGCE